MFCLQMVMYQQHRYEVIITTVTLGFVFHLTRMINETVCGCVYQKACVYTLPCEDVHYVVHAVGDPQIICDLTWECAMWVLLQLGTCLITVFVTDFHLDGEGWRFLSRDQLCPILGRLFNLSHVTFLICRVRLLPVLWVC